MRLNEFLWEHLMKVTAYAYRYPDGRIVELERFRDCTWYATPELHFTYGELNRMEVYSAAPTENGYRITICAPRFSKK